MSNDKKIDELSGTEVTGHEWDGIEELNTPMPRWWLGIMLLTVVWSVGYVILMPGIPLLNSYTKGLLGHTDRGRVDTAITDMHEARSVYAQKLLTTDFQAVLKDPDLLDDPAVFRFALAQGKSLFGDNCETCHGARGRGFIGYPNLNDDIWLWGGSFNEIRQTITYGIRSTHDESRLSIMSAFGRDEILTREEIKSLTDHVLSLSDTTKDKSPRGATLFAQNCVSCHGENGGGSREFGAPDLTDADWLYGGSRAQIRTTIFNGRQGMMPHWNQRLSADQIVALSVYVHSLGGGE
ncbi:MAG: cytochrome-c oxidase, cbb3-type subunit III [Robiginitomaculum sp.]|nr:MAG: cytochrome-c oxidase, cbb3-type subunit III [Robiginitomaculum sp.]